MSLTGSTNEQKIWNYLMDKLGNAYGVAGLMGNLYAESALNPQNLQNSYESKLGYTDATYTAAVDNGSYTNFVGDSAGYGLAQWTYSTRKAGLLSYAQGKGKSVGDLEMQLEYLMKEMQEGYASVLTTLKNAATVLAASNAVLTKYERPADQSTSVQTKRAGYGQTYYDKYAGGTTMTEKELRQKVANTAIGYLGCKESDGSHKKIIDIYNAHKPLARGYAVKYTDAWCATYVSAIAILCEITDIMPTECGCDKMIALYKNLGRWKEDDSYTPSVGDVIFYDWDDSGVGDNTGSSDHVGIVTAVSGTSVTVIEGNKNDAVGYRSMTVNGKYIRGYGLPNYASKAASGSSSGGTSTDTSTGSTGSTSTDTGTAYSVGDIITFTGTTHYTSAAATTGKTCKAGRAKITQISKGAKHPYHLIAESGGGSTVYGWVDAADISGLASYSVGDVVQFAGGKHYASANATSGSTVKAGPAKITQISSGAKHPYHVIHTDNTSAVYGWVDAADIGAASTSGTSGSTSKTHTVGKGDTLSAIASKYGTTVAKIVAANKSKYSTITANYIVIGWTLTIPQ